ncbi:MAG: ATP-dependent DNA helicase [Chromatiales bacterium]|nr:ATP-dependent DNA helicase [Chromatiales bacterium]
MTDIDSLFDHDGPLARTVRGYAPRPAQQQMAVRVDAAIAARETCVVEAGTGTGKTFAYLVPALLSGRKVIVSTATKTLQEQLFRRDLPTVAGALGMPVAVALLKGRANYLCWHRLALAQESARFSAAATDSRLTEIGEWARVTRTGEISEIGTISEASSLWPRITSTAENCLGQRCDDYQRCFVVEARREAMEADIVIVNHHLLLADMALREEGFASLLPGADAVIVDEAHQFPDIAMEFFGIAAGSRQLLRLVEDSTAEGLKLLGGGRLDEDLAAVEQAVRNARLALNNWTGRRDWREIAQAAPAIGEVGERLDSLASTLDGLGEGSPGIAACARRAAKMAARWRDIEKEEEVDGLRWVDIARNGFTLNLTPLDIAGNLQEFFDARPCAWIFTSATLAVGKDFDFYKRRIGIGAADELQLESPFDFKQRSLLYLPAGMPDPASREYTRAVVEQALPLLTAGNGGAFLLFTSHRALREAADILRTATAGKNDWPILVQGEAPRERLLNRFREHGNAVLLGTSSFWQGVDVRGDALRLVVIDKLPFSPPDEPVTRARIEALRREGGNPFREHQLPEAALNLKQGVGRLIRDVTDTGVAMLCDPRLSSRAYGRLFLSSLPPMPRTTACDEAAGFLAADRQCKEAVL